MDSHFKRLLLVEDNPAHAFLIRNQLSQASGCTAQVDWVTDGEEAISYLNRQHPPPDLILLDLKLPRMNGHEVLKHIKNAGRLRFIPVVMMTTSPRESDMEVAYTECVNAYLVKPLGLDELQKMVDSLVEFWCSWNQAPHAD